MRCSTAIFLVMAALCALWLFPPCAQGAEISGDAGVQAGPPGKAFYFPPSPLPKGDPGDVIWARPLAGGAALPSAAINTLVLYRETTIGRRETAVSGAIALPKGTPPASGWPVISWAHGTTGNAPDCAPTLNEFASTEQASLDAWVARGFAVVQTDYEGQGAPGLHPYGVGEAAAHDVTDLVRAARRLYPSIGKRWFAFGHSEGGSASLFTAQYGQQRAPELRLLGVVSFAPASHLSGMIRSMPHENSATPELVFQLGLIEGVASVDPAIHLPDLLTSAALSRLPTLQQRCTVDLMTDDTWVSLPPANVFAKGADLKPLIADFARNDSDRVVTNLPVLLLQGTSDDIVPAVLTESVAEELCENGAHLTYLSVESKNHQTIVTDTLPQVEAWTDAVLAGRTPAATCT